MKSIHNHKVFNIGFILILAAGSMFLFHSTLSGQAETGTVTGRLVSPDGTPLPAGIGVGLIRTDDPPVFFQDHFWQRYYTDTINLENGQFRIEDLSYRDDYILYVYPPDGSNLVSSQPVPFALDRPELSVGEVVLVEPQIAGEFIDIRDGESIDGILRLTATDNPSDTIAVGTHHGRFFFHHLTPGPYTLRGDPKGARVYQPEPISLTIEADPAMLSVTLQSGGPDLYGTIVDPQGNLVEDINLTLSSTIPIDFRPYVYERDGAWESGDLPDGVYTLSADLKYSASQYEHIIGKFRLPEPITVEVPSPQLPITLTMRPWSDGTKSVSGTVVDNGGRPVFSATVTAELEESFQMTTTQTNERGEYRFDLFEGNWNIRIFDDYTLEDQDDWVALNNNETVSFSSDSSNHEVESAVANFTVLRNDVLFNGHVQFANQTDFDYVMILKNKTYGERFTIEDRGPFQRWLPAGDYEISLMADGEIYLQEPIWTVETTFQANTPYDLGLITLEPAYSEVEGRLITSDGKGVYGIWVVARAPGSNEVLFSGQSDADGYYRFKLPPNRWEVSPIVLGWDTYGYSGLRHTIDTPRAGTVSDVDFTFIPRNSTIRGTIVDGDGVPITAADGPIYAFTSYDNAPTALTPLYEASGQVTDGKFELDLIPGRYLLSLGLGRDNQRMEPNRYYGTTIVSIEADETLEVNLPAQQATAQISTTLRSIREPELSPQISGRMTVTLRSGQFELQQVRYENRWNDHSDLSLAVVPGKWQVDWELGDHCWTESDYYGIFEYCNYANFLPAQSPLSVEVAAEEVELVDLPAYRRSSEIVVQGDLRRDGYGPELHLTGQGELDGLTQQFPSMPPYRSRITALPWGDWVLQAKPHTNAAGWYASEPLPFSIEADEFQRIDIEFQGPNAVLTGSVTALNMTTSQTATIKVETIGSGFMDQEIWLTSNGVHATGSYSMPIRSGTLRVSGTVGDEQRTLWYGEQTADDSTLDEKSLDLTLYAQGVLPRTAFNRFFKTENVRMYLRDGAQVGIPAGTVSGMGIYEATITPGYHYPYVPAYHPLGHGYEIKIATLQGGDPIGLPYAQEIEWQIRYDLDFPYTLASVNQIEVAAYSPQTNQWTIVSNVERNLENGTITIKSNQYTKVALVVSRSALVDPADLNVSIYLPAIFKE